MFAVVKTGGKQYKVRESDVVRVDRILKPEGDRIVFDEILMASNGSDVFVGSPVLSHVKVEAVIVEEMRDKKIIVFKKKRRHNYRRKKGHRQYLTVVKIEKILFS